MTFEESFKKLETMSQKISSRETSLEEAVACYEEGMECYRTCDEILKETEQKIEVFRR